MYLPDEHNTDIDHSQYKLCLCNTSSRLRLDIGFNVLTTANRQGRWIHPALILPSVVLIFLLIALFAYAHLYYQPAKKIGGVEK